MKKFKIFFGFAMIILFSSRLVASDWIKLKPNQDNNSKYFELLSSDISTFTIHFHLSGFWKKTVNTSRGKAWLISDRNAASILRKGAPDLPLFATSLIIPDEAAMEVALVSLRYKEFKNVLMVPSKGNLPRTINPAGVSYEFGAQYRHNKNYPGKIGKLRKPYIIRDFRGQALLIQPFQYNPITKILRVYYDVTVEVKQKGISKVNVLKRLQPLKKIDSRFANIYARHFLNYSALSRNTPVDEHGNMLIISYGDFIDNMAVYVEWREKTGTPVSIVDVATIGNAAAIKQYIANYYAVNGLTFVLLVGDAPEVPVSVIGGNYSDNKYSYIVGNDHYPDLFVGRFSAETDDQVNTMVQRTLDYEQNPPTDTAWYTKAIGIGSDQGPGDDDEYDYQHIRNIGNSKLLPFTYNYTYELFDGSQGGNDASGNPFPSMVAADINSGTTIINYCGHGSTALWGTSGFSNNDVNNLVNDNHLPFIISVACANGNFVHTTCFAEAWTRATHNGQPTGAIATIMSTINQSWNPPMCGQDAMNDILAETYSNNIKRTFGGITMDGCMTMNDEYGSDGYEITDTWTIFGDPSLMIRTAIPQNMTVVCPSTLNIGQTSMTLTTNTIEGIACLSMGGNIIGTASIDSTSSATITFSPLSQIGTAALVVTSFNFIPHTSPVPIVPAAGPYVAFVYDSIDNANGNGELDYHETAFLTIGLTNEGSDSTTNILSTLSTDDSYALVSDSTAYYGTILTDDTVAIQDGFALCVDDTVEDGHILNFQLISEDTLNGDNWTSAFNIVVHAPVLQNLSFSITDSAGNNNGRLDPGETAIFAVIIVNSGSSEAYNVFTVLSSQNNYISVANNQQSLVNMPAGDTTTVFYQVTAAGDTPDEQFAVFSVDITAGYNRSASGSFYTTIGQKPVAIINLSGNHSLSDSMHMCFQILQVSDNDFTGFPNDLDIYRSVFVLLGNYPNNYALSMEEGQSLANYLYQGGRLYMEGGDTWFFDDKTAVHPMFHIIGFDDGNADLGTIYGQDSSIMNGLSFRYKGDNNYIDHIAADDSGIMIFKNQLPAYGTAVSFENNIYKTIGSSFEFAGLTDSPGNEKDEVMARMLRFFNVNYTWTVVEKIRKKDIQIRTFPNPFNSKVTISLLLQKPINVAVDIYNVSGKKIVSLSDKKMGAGNQQFVWNAQETHAIAGIYYVKLLIGNQLVIRKIVLSNFMR